MRWILGIAMATILTGLAPAQTFPVQVNTQLIPPYSTYLSDYASPGSDGLSAYLLLADAAIPSIDYRLRVVIEGQGIRISTSPGYLPSRRTLFSGEPLQLVGSDWQEYLDPRHLVFEGISGTAFSRSGGQLPEGLYRFCVEVIEYNRGVTVSAPACGMAWLILNDPPLVNLPQNGVTLNPLFPQHVVFQWTPRHTASPNAAFAVEYAITLVEVWPTNRNPEDAIRTTRPLFQTVTAAPQFVYGPAEPPLELGRHYAFRVRAQGMMGESADMFRNDGYSETVTFQYGQECLPPQQLEAESIHAGSFRIRWQPQFNHSAFRVRYREADSHTWHEETTGKSVWIIEDLQPATTYEVQVSGACGDFESEASGLLSFTTAPLPERNYTCGMPAEEVEWKSQQPLPQLKVGDRVNAGDFMVKIREARGTQGRFSGAGGVVIPYLDNVEATVHFEEVLINDAYQMTEGEMHVQALTYQPPPGPFEFLDELQEGMDDFMAGIALYGAAHDSLLQMVNDIRDEDAFTPGQADSIAQLTVSELRAGAVQLLASVQDDIGAGQVPAAAQKMAQARVLNRRAAQLEQQGRSSAQTDLIAIDFAPGDAGGWDDPPADHTAFDLHYAVLSSEGDHQKVPWGSVGPGGARQLTATLRPHVDVDPEAIRFEQDDGEQVQASRSGASWTVPVTGPRRKNQTTIVRALRDTSIVGMAQLRAYEPLERQVYLVAVNDTPLPDLSFLEEALNDIYAPALVNWTVEAGPAFSWRGPPIVWSSSADFSSYTVEMQDLIRAFKDAHDTEREAFYLFVFPDSGDGPNGYMPRRRRFGFLFNTSIKTLAHELGHGAFGLQHTWEEFPNLSQSSTDNLMDYRPDGTVLRKYQWDQIHDPNLVISLFDAEDEGAQVGGGDVAFLYRENDIPCSTCNFLSPGGMPFTLSEVVEVVLLQQAGNESWEFDPDNPQPMLVADDLNKMALYGFKLSNGEEYLPHFSTSASGDLLYFNWYYTRLPDGSMKSISFPESQHTLSRSYAITYWTYDESSAVQREREVSEPIRFIEPQSNDGSSWSWSAYYASGPVHPDFGWEGLDIAAQRQLSSGREDYIAAAELIAEQLSESEISSLFSEIKAVPENDYCGVVGTAVIAAGEEVDIQLLRLDINSELTHILVSEYGISMHRFNAYTSDDFSDRIKWNLAYWDQEFMDGNTWANVYVDIGSRIGGGWAFTIHGFATGEDLLTGEKLAWWEHALGLVDFAEVGTFSKALISLKAIKVGGRAVKLVQFTDELRQVISHAFIRGVRFGVDAVDNSIIVLKHGGRNIARIVNGKLEALHVLNGGTQLGPDVDGVYLAVQDGVLGFVRSGAASNISSRLLSLLRGKGWSDELIARLDLDLSDAAFKARFSEEWVDAWRVLDEVGETALRKDIGELNLVSKYLDDIEAAGGYKNWKAFDNLFSSSRQRAIEKFGKEAEDLIYVKFKDDGGAAAVILDRYGDAGLAALKKVDNLDAAASELIKDKSMYRYVDENARYLNSLKESGAIPSGYTTYVTLGKFDDPVRASSKMQLPPENNAAWRLEFEGDQLVDKVQFPTGKFNNAEYKEILTRSFPEWGEGGATQFITTSGFKITKMVNLKTGEIINFD